MMARQATVQTQPEAFDLLRTPGLGAFLRHPIGRRVLQALLLVASIVMILHGFFGPQLAPKNLATVLTWVHYRGVLVLALLVAGNLFCLACPFTLARDLARRFFKPVLNWPRALRHKGIAIALFVLILFSYELFDLWASPWMTAWLIVGYFAGALIVDSLFKNASFCKYVCPIGQFNFAASTVSPLEVKVRDLDTCATCRTLDCIKGTRAPEDESIVIQRGCELALFQPLKTGNMDCTFCLDCVHACPHDNVAITTRLPGEELWHDERRSGVGRLSKRPDLAILAILFTFGALLNAFGMVSPVYVVQGWMAAAMGTTMEAPVLGGLFFVALVLEPLLLLGLAASLTRRAARSGENLLQIATRFAHALIPLGLGIWLAHYSFHLLSGLWTFIPVAQQAIADLGKPLLGTPAWHLTGLAEGLVRPLEVGFVGLGVLGSVLVAFRIAARSYGRRPWVASLPWIVLCIALGFVALWVLDQPMEMRSTFMGG